MKLLRRARNLKLFTGTSQAGCPTETTALPPNKHVTARPSDGLQVRLRFSNGLPSISSSESMSDGATPGFPGTSLEKEIYNSKLDVKLLLSQASFLDPTIILLLSVLLFTASAA